MSHTPGPWRIIFGGFESDDGFGIGTDNAAASRVKVTAECWPCTIIDQQHRAELSANARLIAAAPDLLAACQFVMTKIKECMAEMEAAGQKPQIKDYEEVAVIQSAIDKATLAR